MSKKTYFPPQALVAEISFQSLLAASNALSSDGSSIDFNGETMEAGDGSDASVKGRGSYGDYSW